MTSAIITLRNLRAAGLRNRRLLIVLLAAWLGLSVQPCAIAAPAAAASMEHCGHGVPADSPAPCPAMQAGHCEMSVEANIDSSRTGSEAPVPVLTTALAMLDLPVDGACAPVSDRGIRAGPSLYIRFCNLRN